MPSTCDLDHKRSTGLLGLLLSIAFIIQSILLIMFIYLQIQIRWTIGIMHCSILLIVFFLLKKQNFFYVIQLVVFDIIASAIIDTYLFGWSTYFGLYLIAAALIIINAFSIKPHIKTCEVLLILITFIITFILSRNEIDFMKLDPHITDGLALFNLISVVFAIFYLQFQLFNNNESLKKSLEELLDTDTLTKIYNRRFFNKYLDVEVKRNESQIKYKRNTEINFGIAMLDIDNFKIINDTYGHLAGDEVLINLANLMKTNLFERDILCRYGGEEFVILFTDTSRSGALIAIEKIRRMIAEHTFHLHEKDIPAHVTASIGFASFDEEPDISKLLELADHRLYAAKKAGKNRVMYE